MVTEQDQEPRATRRARERVIFVVGDLSQIEEFEAGFVAVTLDHGDALQPIVAVTGEREAARVALASLLMALDGAHSGILQEALAMIPLAHAQSESVVTVSTRKQ